MNYTSMIAYAQDATNGATPGLPGGLMNLLPFVLIFVVFYFVLIRPQHKKEKERKNMISKLQSGDRVLTIGGIYGTITAVKEEQGIVVLKIADGAKVEFAKSAIQNKVV